MAFDTLSVRTPTPTTPGVHGIRVRAATCPGFPTKPERGRLVAPLVADGQACSCRTAAYGGTGSSTRRAAHGRGGHREPARLMTAIDLGPAAAGRLGRTRSLHRATPPEPSRARHDRRLPVQNRIEPSAPAGDAQERDLRVPVTSNGARRRGSPRTAGICEAVARWSPGCDSTTVIRRGPRARSTIRFVDV